ncbi:hypothetical protein DEA8626_03587 [Defluviimonas aquaemixtae]|uniref:SCP domain-containing protein n=2 Tax=Albidovulum aquaemixtae TaxID=1542388 RepID=A0A2R8BM87_9RHOB|nr:hypothetical protein DEA8626_03587 [Defluviimonas aquaemixtae]
MAILVATVLISGTAEACSRAQVRGADAVVQAGTKLNQPLIDAAIRAEVNYHRCKAGLPAVSDAGGLRKVAAVHARWMAKRRSLTHKSSVPGQSTSMARLKASGLRVRAGAENIGLVSRFRLDGRRFRITDAASCRFATSGGQAIPAHTYASLSKHIVSLWMSSQGHRRNILDRRMKRLGSGAGFDPRGSNCGKFYVSQTFAG